MANGTWRGNGGGSSSSFDPDVPWVLYSPGNPDGSTAGPHLNCGEFWYQPILDFGNRWWWEGWACFDTPTLPGNNQYIVSDGYTGLHAMLFGWDQTKLTGNVYDGVGSTSYGSDDPVAALEWFHFVTMCDGTNIAVFKNGICSGRATAPATRRALGRSSGGGHLYVFGSDHNNMQGWLAWLGAWDSHCPVAGGANPYASIFPERFPRVDRRSLAGSVADEEFIDRELLLSCQTPGVFPVPDMSRRGYRGKHHPGVPFNPYYGPDQYGYRSAKQNILPGLRYEQSTTYPNVYSGTRPTIVVTTPTAPSTPSGARVFDSFSRAPQHYAAFDVPTGLGSTEATGSLGALAWTEFTWGAAGTRPKQYGIMDGLAVFIGDAVNSGAWVENGSANMRVSVKPRKGTYGVYNAPICFRYVDANNFWYMYWEPSFAVVRCISGGVQTVQQLYAVASFTEWGVNCNGNNITVFTNAGDLGTFADATHNTATKAGLYHHNSGAAVDSLVRYDDFTVKAAV